MTMRPAPNPGEPASRAGELAVSADEGPADTTGPLALPLRPATVLLPPTGLRQWCVIAADQYTSSPQYWQDLDAKVGEAPSTLRMILPEVYLATEDEATLARRVRAAQQASRDYLDEALVAWPNTVVYVERATRWVPCRQSLVVALDLDAYSYLPPTTPVAARRAQVRASEATILDRIPAREAIRRGAALESPHVQVLYDDPGHTVMSVIARHQVTDADPWYDTELLAGGGSVRGWRVSGDGEVWRDLHAALSALGSQRGFRFLVGDGNHSLAAAKTHWERLRADGAPDDHPARWALVELLNIHDPGLRLEPIHRVVRGVDAQDVIAAAERYAAQATRTGAVGVLGPDGLREVQLPMTGPLVIPALDRLLGELVAAAGLPAATAIDYIHGDDELERLVAAGDAVGLRLPALERSDLFNWVAERGPMPRKSFSLGEADEKRFYCECRAIVTR